jgi:hypothetical protein
VEPVITAAGRDAPDARSVAAPKNRLALELTPVPVFVY